MKKNNRKSFENIYGESVELAVPSVESGCNVNGLSVIVEGRATTVSLTYETTDKAEDVAFALAHSDVVTLYPSQIRRANITTKTTVMMRRVIR